MPENNFISAVRGYLRLGNFPLDASSVYESFQDASNYASTNPTAYAGQLVAVVDEVARTVTVYQLGFKIDENETGFELQSLSTSGTGGVVKTVNGIEPDDNGDIALALDNFISFLQNTQTRVIFNKMIQVPTLSISQDDDVITNKYLQAKLNDLFDGSSRTLGVTFDNTGGVTTEIIPGGSLIKRVILKITEPFEETDITISINNTTLFSPEDIFETEAGTYMVEPFLTLTGTAANEYALNISVPSSLTGEAELYVDFNINFTK
jgi:hypothetical protein